MKRDFHGYYKPTNEEFDTIWNEAIIVVDANVMLNLYTYSATTALEILSLLGEVGERLWMPYQVAFEYHENRCGIIIKESRRYAEIAKALEAVGVALRARKQHPYITADLVTKFEGIEADIKKDLAEGESKHRDLITTDSICEKITELFTGRVGASMIDEELERIYKEGAIRYTRKIPPGFSDAKKPEPARYGDLVLWYQLINHAKTSKRPVILVTDDLKEDWWAFAGDRRIGPRPELRHEFRRKAGQDIYIYSSDAFVDIANERWKKLSESATEEIEDASKERQQVAIEERTLKQLSCDPFEQCFKQQEMMDKLTRDPFEKFRKQQEMMDKFMYDPYEKFRKRQEMMDKLTRDPFERFRKQQEMMDNFMYDPYEKFRKQQEMMDKLTRDPFEKFRNSPGDFEESESDEDKSDKPQPDEDQQDKDE
ncbi:MAG: PIN-like domain-containing protein [Desulfobulbia bacterium]